jgi:hypothetical protein
MHEEGIDTYEDDEEEEDELDEDDDECDDDDEELDEEEEDEDDDDEDDDEDDDDEDEEDEEDDDDEQEEDDDEEEDEGLEGKMLIYSLRVRLASATPPQLMSGWQPLFELASLKFVLVRASAHVAYRWASICNESIYVYACGGWRRNTHYHVMHLRQYWSCAYLKTSMSTLAGIVQLYITGVNPGVVKQPERVKFLQFRRCLAAPGPWYAISPRVSGLPASTACTWYAHAMDTRHVSSTLARVEAVISVRYRVMPSGEMRARQACRCMR